MGFAQGEEKVENENAEYWCNKGNEFCEAKNYEGAIKCYEKAIQLEPDSPWHFVDLGETLYCLAKIKQDEKLFDEAENLFNKAIEKYEKAIQQISDYPLPFVCWGETLCCLAKIKQDKNLFKETEALFREAIEKYDKATELDHDNSYAFIRKGITLINLAEIKQDKNLSDEATECFKETEKSILDILVYLNKEEVEQINKTGVLHPLLNSNTDEGKFFNEAIKGEPEERLNKYKEIYILSIFIISQLRINNEYEKSVAHYTKKTTAQEILFNKSKFRIGAVNNFNDPTEGEILLKYLFDKKDNPSKEKTSNTEYRAFAGCFTFNHDSLNQFRLYGKDNNREGTGLSLIFKENFFSRKLKMATEIDDETKVNTLMRGFGLEDEDENKKYTLFRCIYIDPKEQRMETVGQKEKYLFYRKTDKEEAEKKYEKYKEYIDGVINTVDGKMNELKKLTNGNPDLDQNVIGQLLINLRYLTKNIAFKEEQECRIVKICRINGENKIYFDEENRMYIEYEPDIFYSSKFKPEVISRIEKVYFGPKATNIESFQDRLKIDKLEGKIIFEKSENKLA